MARDEKEELAVDRTDLAEDRTLLANERTFAGWLRTAMACIGIGLGFNALFNTLQPEWIPKALATAFLIIGGFIIVAAERRACSVTSRLSAHRVETFRPMNMRLITVVLLLATIGLVAGIWILA